MALRAYTRGIEPTKTKHPNKATAAAATHRHRVDHVVDVAPSQEPRRVHVHRRAPGPDAKGALELHRGAVGRDPDEAGEDAVERGREVDLPPLPVSCLQVREQRAGEARDAARDRRHHHGPGRHGGLAHQVGHGAAVEAEPAKPAQRGAIKRVSRVKCARTQQDGLKGAARTRAAPSSWQHRMRKQGGALQQRAPEA